jgi:hypothetical protein
MVERCCLKIVTLLIVIKWNAKSTLFNQIMYVRLSCAAHKTERDIIAVR